MATNPTAGSVLDAFLGETNSVSTATKVLKDNYSKLVAHRNLSSYSMQQVLHSCPRNVTFAFGHAVGAGVATYDKTLDLRAAIWDAFLAWDIDLLEIETKETYADGSGKPTGKSFAHAIYALEKYEVFAAEETNLMDYETVKIEASIAVDFEDGYFYVGHLDELLIHKTTGRFLVKENKTTGMRSVDAAMYSNSDQALSYAVVVDMLGGADFEVLYTIYSSTAQEWIQHSFVKDTLRKASWIQDQFMDMATINSVSDIAAIEEVDYATTLSAIVARQKEKTYESR